MIEYRTVKKASEIEVTINRSRFIGRCFPVKSEEEALAFLANIRKQHWDARHNCYAYAIGERSGIARYSDDGEPGGTAGMPIMDVLRRRDITDVLIVVTRYFGGILLGTGGLVRAYSKSAAEAVDSAGILTMAPGTLFEIEVDYSRYGAIESYLRGAAQIRKLDFVQAVKIRALVRTQEAAVFQKELSERTDGTCFACIAGEAYLEIP